MNIFELILFILGIWFIAWLTNVIANSLDMPLFAASGITAFGFVLLVSLFHQARKKLGKDSQANQHHD